MARRGKLTEADLGIWASFVQQIRPLKGKSAPALPEPPPLQAEPAPPTFAEVSAAIAAMTDKASRAAANEMRGRLTDPGLPHCGESVAGRVLMIAEPVGSSSSSAVLLELLHAGTAPAAIVLGRTDAIVGLGILVSREMGWATIPLLVMAPAEQEKIADGEIMKIG